MDEEAKEARFIHDLSMFGGPKVVYDASMVNLPTNVETFRTFDKRMLYKTGDVGQCLLVHERPNAAANQFRGMVMRSGLTPPTQDIRTRFEVLGRTTVWRKAIQIKERVDDLIRWEKIRGYKVELVDGDEYDQYGDVVEAYDANDEKGWRAHYAQDITVSKIILRISKPTPSVPNSGRAWILSEGSDSIIYDEVGAVYIPPEVAVEIANQRTQAALQQAQASAPSTAFSAPTATAMSTATATATPMPMPTPMSMPMPMSMSTTTTTSTTTSTAPSLAPAAAPVPMSITPAAAPPTTTTATLPSTLTPGVPSAVTAMEGVTTTAVPTSILTPLHPDAAPATDPTIAASSTVPAPAVPAPFTAPVSTPISAPVSAPVPIPALAPVPVPAPAPAEPAAPVISPEAQAIMDTIADLKQKAASVGNPVMRMRFEKQIAAQQAKLDSLSSS